MDVDDSPRKVDTDITWPNLTYLFIPPAFHRDKNAASFLYTYVFDLS